MHLPEHVGTASHRAARSPPSPLALSSLAVPPSPLPPVVLPLSDSLCLEGGQLLMGLWPQGVLGISQRWFLKSFPAGETLTFRIRAGMLSFGPL